MIDDKLVHEALERIARTPDGRVFFIGLQKIVMGIPSDSSDGALRENLGRRKFASEIRQVMGKSIKDAEPNGTDPDARPIVYSVAEPVAVSGSARGARRRVSTKPQSGQS